MRLSLQKGEDTRSGLTLKCVNDAATATVIKIRPTLTSRGRRNNCRLLRVFPSCGIRQSHQSTTTSLTILNDPVSSFCQEAAGDTSSSCSCSEWIEFKTQQKVENMRLYKKGLAFRRKRKTWNKALYCVTRSWGQISPGFWKTVGRSVSLRIRLVRSADENSGGAEKQKDKSGKDNVNLRIC